MALVNFQTWEMCELKCKFCLYSFMPKIKGGWSLEKFKLAADRLIEIGVDRFDMTPTLGEITLDPTWKEKLLHIDGRVDYIQLYTHGLNLVEGDFDFLLGLKSPLTLFFSVYGDSVDSFKETTGSGRYERFLESFLLIRKKLPLPPNKRVGADIRFRAVELPLKVENIDLSNRFWREILTLVDQEKNFVALNKYQNNNWGRDFPEQSYAKDMPELLGACDCANLTLNPNGDAVICDICHPYDENFEILGNIFKDGAAEIYRKARQIWKEMEEGKFPKICENCTEYTCEGDREDYFDSVWKTRDKVFWEDSFLESIGLKKKKN